MTALDPLERNITGISPYLGIHSDMDSSARRVKGLLETRCCTFEKETASDPNL